MQIKFCPNCKAELREKDANFSCPKCDFEFYLNPKPTNAAILENDKGEILMIRRAKEPKKGLWDLPGGFIDVDETFEESTKRELREELGTDARNLKYFVSYPDVYEYSGVTYYTVTAIFTGKIESKLARTEEFSEMRFFPKAKIPFGEIAFESLERALKDYLKKV